MKERLWRGFKLFFKIWIGLMVIVYFALMLVLLVALMLAQRSGDRDSRDRDDSGGMAAGLMRVMMEGLQYAFFMRAYSTPVYAVDDYGYRFRTPAAPRGVRSKGKSFIIAIYDLALGPERAQADPLENEKEVAAYLRAEGGVLAPAEIVALSGSTMAEAEERMADYLVRFNGDPDITDEGVVVGEFDAFLSGTQAQTDARIVPYWDEYEAPYEHSGNSSGRNAAIIGMILFTMAVGIGMLAGGLQQLTVYGRFFGTGAARFLIGYFPIVFSLSYLLISLLRLPGTRSKENARLARNQEKRVMRAIFQQRLFSATADQIYFAMVAAGEKDLKREQIGEVLQRVLPKLQGTLELGADGEPIYTFDRIRREVEACEQRRNGKRIG